MGGFLQTSHQVMLAIELNIPATDKDALTVIAIDWLGGTTIRPVSSMENCPATRGSVRKGVPPVTAAVEELTFMTLVLELVKFVLVLATAEGLVSVPPLISVAVAEKLDSKLNEMPVPPKKLET